MASDKIVVDISIDGSALNNGSKDAKAGYGMVIRLNDAIAEYKSVLCSGCDAGRHTNNRAELRAAQSAVNFLHELAKIGHHKNCQLVPCQDADNHQEEDHDYLSDHRTIDGSNIVGNIRTDSTYVQRGATGLNRKLTHKDVWEVINRTIDCMTGAGVDLYFKHVRGHSGDEDNERADVLARKIADKDYNDENFPSEATCVTCDEKYDSLADLAVHCKETHMERAVFAESIGEAMYKGKASGIYECIMCEREFGSGRAMKQHLRDKHGYVIA